MEIKEYFEKMYKDGTNGIITESGIRHTGYCPFCGGTDWDLETNDHQGITDTINYSCDCGAEWTEHWEITKIVRTK